MTRSLTNSNNFKERARKVVPHLTGTFSKSARSNVEGWNKTVERFGLDAKMYGYPIRMHTQCFDSNNKESLSMKSLLLQEMIKKGIFMSVLGRWNTIIVLFYSINYEFFYFVFSLTTLIIE